MWNFLWDTNRCSDVANSNPSVEMRARRIEFPSVLQGSGTQDTPLGQWDFVEIQFQRKKTCFRNSLDLIIIFIVRKKQRERVIEWNLVLQRLLVVKNCPLESNSIPTIELTDSSFNCVAFSKVNISTIPDLRVMHVHRDFGMCSHLFVDQDVKNGKQRSTLLLESCACISTHRKAQA